MNGSDVVRWSFLFRSFVDWHDHNFRRSSVIFPESKFLFCIQCQIDSPIVGASAWDHGCQPWRSHLLDRWLTSGDREAAGSTEIRRVHWSGWALFARFVVPFFADNCQMRKPLVLDVVCAVALHVLRLLSCARVGQLRCVHFAAWPGLFLELGISAG